MISIEEMDQLAKAYKSLEKKAQNNKKHQKEFENIQAKCIDQLSYMVFNKTSKYKKFSNYDDLVQSGFEALLCALKTFDSKKGSFAWWANRYISTRISRVANTHSTIRIPMTKAKEMPPYKVANTQLEEMSHFETTGWRFVDFQTPQLSLESAQRRQDIAEAIEQLPAQQQQIIKLVFEFESGAKSNINWVSEELKISRATCIKLLEEAKQTLQNLLQNKYQNEEI